MTNEIENQVSANIEKIEVKLRNLGMKLASILISSWLIVGLIGMGIVLPAYLVMQAFRFQWTKEAQAGMERAEESKREPRISVSPNVYHSQQYQRGHWGTAQHQTDIRSDVRNMTNTLNEARYFVRSAADLAVR